MFARLLTHRYMAVLPVSLVLSMERSIIRNSKDKCVRSARCVKLVLQQAVLDYLRSEWTTSDRSHLLSAGTNAEFLTWYEYGFQHAPLLLESFEAHSLPPFPKLQSKAFSLPSQGIEHFSAWIIWAARRTKVRGQKDDGRTRAIIKREVACYQRVAYHQYQ